MLCDGESGEEGGEKAWADDVVGSLPVTGDCVCGPLLLWAATRVERRGVKGVQSSS